MSPDKISEKVVTNRLAWIQEMVVGVRSSNRLSPARLDDQPS
jgi:hypothetical protein